MARTFDDGDGDDKKSRDKGNYSHPLGAAANLSPSDTPEPPPLEVIEEVAEEGRHLYLDFIRTEISRNGLTDTCITVEETLVGPPDKMLEWVRAGKELRQLADAFSRSKERDAVRQKASKIPVETLDIDHFMQLLQELFQGGAITRERIVVLFFFCADVAMQALRQGLHSTFHRLVEWSLRYIATQVAAWVYSCGGWVKLNFGVVLRSGLDVVYQLSACCAFVAIVAACVVYIKKK
ncbi:apoptosis regulator BAX isoform X2 [Folsomia candida]|uniref:apoptosis regulator BAX isoform X2 n=1 Tax=Folsomia candida TaxID=158441 RepID=UPI000B9044E6|nr:apoptosis regulator BAX isoform X2 [Folsomia candida]